MAPGARPAEDPVRLHQHADVAADDPTCARKYDVIVFPPVGRARRQRSSAGMPMYGNPLPWKTTALTPNLGKIDSDRRHAARARLAGAGRTCRSSCREGGLLIAVDDTANFAVQFGLARRGVRFAGRAAEGDRRGRCARRCVDATSPIVYGYARTCRSSRRTVRSSA